MALLQWNVHGFSGVGRKRELLQLVNKYMIKIIGLMETKIRRTNQGKTKKKSLKGSGKLYQIPSLLILEGGFNGFSRIWQFGQSRYGACINNLVIWNLPMPGAIPSVQCLYMIKTRWMKGTNCHNPNIAQRVGDESWIIYRDFNETIVVHMRGKVNNLMMKVLMISEMHSK